MSVSVITNATCKCVYKRPQKTDNIAQRRNVTISGHKQINTCKTVVETSTVYVL